MKLKKIVLGVIALSLVATLTTGCGQKAELKNGEEVAVKVDGAKITADEYYNEIKTNNVATLVDMIDHELFDEKFGNTDEEKDAIKEQMETLKKQYTDEATYNQVILQYFGAQNDDELKEVLQLEYRRNAAVNDYIDSNIR